MFESEDFDLDEDFLKDIGEKEEEYYSQRTEPESRVDPPAKRRKSEPPELDPFGDITFDDEPDFAKGAPKLQSPQSSKPESKDVLSRKQRILEIFNTGGNSQRSENALQRSPQLSHLASPKKSPQTSSSANKNLEASRRNAALEILQRGSQNYGKNVENPSSQGSNNPRAKSTDENSEMGSSHCSEETGRKIAMAFKKPADRASPRKFAARSSPKFRAAPRMTLVRKFPGPAGLLPDSPESNLDHANFLNGLDADDRAIDENLEDPKIADYCSQNTERLFSSGAWRAMLDDLPANFLKGHEIATIKRSSRESWEKSRVSFVAGVVQRIDQSVENPRLVLKDMTDSIEATMHSDVNLHYPDVLEPGVVVLLRGAGLLGFLGSQKCPGLQYHLMISPRNLVAVYSEKARLISSPWMESMKKKTAVATADDAGESGGIDENDANVASARQQKILSERNPVFSEEMEISDFDSLEDDLAFACSNLGDTKDSPVVFSFSKTEAKTSAKFSFGGSRGRTEEQKNSISAEPGIDQRRNESPRNIAKKSPNRKNIEKTASEISAIAKIEIRPKPIKGVVSKLRQFRSDDVLTPPVGQARDEAVSTSTRTDAENPTEDTKDGGECILGTFADDLLASDDDTEDEILSQLDVDAIMTNYNAST